MKSMIRPRQTAICREGWYYLLILMLVYGQAVFHEVNLLLVLTGMLAGPLLLSWRAVVVTLRGLEVQRKVPQGVCAGDLLVANVSLVNTRRRIGSWAVVVEERVQRLTASPQDDCDGEEPLRPSVLFPYVPAGQSRKGVYRGRLTRRGRYRLGPLRLSTRFPFGLFRRTITVGQTDTLMVYPRTGRLTRRWAARHHESFAGTRRREQRHGLEGDLYGTRQWRSGDSRRWIHWRSTARAGKLVVRQFEQPRNREIAVLVDLWQPQRPAPEDLENVELAVSFAATVLADLCRKGGSDLLLATTGTQPELISGPASAALLQDMMQRLATVEASSEDRLAELLEKARRARGKTEHGSEIVLVSTRPIEPTDTASLASLRADPVRRTFHKTRRIRYVDVSNHQLAEYFQPE